MPIRIDRLTLVWACDPCGERYGIEERHGYAEKGVCACCGASKVRVVWRPLDLAAVFSDILGAKSVG